MTDEIQATPASDPIPRPAMAQPIDRSASGQTRTLVQMSAKYEGLLPPPDWMNAYNVAIPNGADRIVRMAEKQEDHRQLLERKKVLGDITAERLGLFFGLIVALTGIGAGSWLIYLGHDWAGAALAGVPLVSLVSVFVYGRNAQSRERAAQRELMQRAIGEKDKPPKQPGPRKKGGKR